METSSSEIAASRKKKHASLVGLLQSDAWQYVLEELKKRESSAIARMIRPDRDAEQLRSDSAEIRAYREVTQIPHDMVRRLGRDTQEGT